MNLKCLACWLCAFLCAATGWSAHHARDDNPSPIIRWPYLQLATTNSIYVVWRTESSITPVVRFGTSLENLDRVISGPSILLATANTNKNLKLPPGVRKLHSGPQNCWQYEAHITGLQPDTSYYYGIYDADNRLTEEDGSFHFRTLPVPGSDRSMRFWVVGDSGVGRETQSAVQEAMMNYVAQDKRPLDMYLHLGDMAYYSGRDVEFQSRFFEFYDPTMRQTVCWATMGNHEGMTSKGTNGSGPYYDAFVLPTKGEAGGLASGTEAFYSFDFGRAHFICLDSHDLDRKPTKAMATWLQADLDQTKSDWIIAYFHHPPYTKGSHDSDREKQLIEMRTHILPILESGGVDLVLTGHSHIYERSMLIDGAYGTPTVAEGFVLDDGDGDPNGDGPYRKSAGLHPNEGAVQIVAGNGGIHVRRRATSPVMRQIIVEHGSVIVDIKGDTLDAIMLNKFGEIRDHFGIVKRSVVTVSRNMSPWQALAYKTPKGPDGKEPPPEPPEDAIDVIPKHAEWKLFTGGHPEPNWNALDYDDSSWRSAPAGFGYDYPQETRTVLSDMKGKYQTIYIRHEFEIEHAEYLAELGLMVSYDDGFIAYLNGKEVLRVNVGKDRGKDAKDVKSRHSTERYSYHQLKDFEKHVKDGRNVLSIEGHNSSLNSGSFLLDPYLLFED